VFDSGSAARLHSASGSRYLRAVQEPKPSAAKSPLPDRFGHFAVVRALGAGFSAHVYEAEAAALGRRVVLKVLTSTAGRDSLTYRRFEREARLLASLRHENLVELLDFFPGGPVSAGASANASGSGPTGEDPPYMVLEHVAGASLAEVLAKLGALSPDEAAAVALELARGLAYAHGAGVVHRDVKPANVLIGRAHVGGGADARAPVAVKLGDFGVAVRGGEPSIEAEESLGTPAYMAPEQLLGENIDARADQFALGIVLYQCLTGVRPFDGDDGRPQIHRVRRDPPRPFRALGVAVPRALERIVLRCLQKRPAERYESTQELVAELAAYLSERFGPAPDLALLHRRVLSRAGVLDERKLPREEPDELGRERRRSPAVARAVPLSPALAGMTAALLAMFAGGLAIQVRAGTFGRARAPEAAVRATGPVSSGEGKIAVRVRPWADVAVDGERIDTTPLREPIRVRAGKHVVSLTHPAATERRTVDVPPGGLVTVDVVLDVGPAIYDDEFLPPQPSAASSVSAAPSASARPVASSLTGG
jgi:serine/threonine protein kinase